MWRCKQAILMYSSPSVTPRQTHFSISPHVSTNGQLLLFHQQSGVFITRYEHEGPRITVTSNVCNYSCFFTDIQECYEVTLQLNEEQTVVKEDGEQDAWEVIFFFALPGICLMFTLSLAPGHAVASRCLVAASVSCLTLRHGWNVESGRLWL